MKKPTIQFLLKAVILCNSCVEMVQAKIFANKKERQTGQSKPNILLVLADDVGTGDVPGYWGTGMVDMPNLEQLVNDGVVFTDAHSTPLCSPSRYVLLSGNYQHRGLLYTGTWKLNYHSSQFLDGQQSIADVLKANGYHTAMMGKWHIGGKVPTKSWFDPGDKFYINEQDSILTKTKHDWTKPIRHGPQDIGFDSSYITTSGIQGAPYAFVRDGFMQSMSNITAWRKGTYNMPEGASIILQNGEGSKSWDSTAYNMILVNETERFLDDHIEKRSDDPFFAYVALGNVHIPHSPPISFLDGTPVAGEYSSPHMDILLEMDKVFGSLTALLKERDMEDDTIIVFASDNGGLGRKYSFKYGHNSHGPFKGAKGSIYEGGHRIPLIMKWKNGNVPSGESRSHIVGLNDLYATLCNLADVDVPSGQAMDSLSFANYLKNDTQQANLREYLGAWTVNQGTIFEESIRKNSLKLIRNRHNGSVTLYDLDNDISESNSLISQQSYASVAAEMIKKLEEIAPCYDNDGIFNVERSNGIIFQTTCEWFAAQKNRCEVHTEGKVKCRLSCAGRSEKACVLSPSAPSSVPRSSVPTVKPTINQSNILSNTPSNTPTLGLGTECHDSEEFTFGSWEWQNATRTRTCDWLTHRNKPKITEQRISKWCNKRYNGFLVSDYCPHTCSMCDYPSGVPSTHQTSPPSFIPVIDCGDSAGFTFGISQWNGVMRSCHWLTHKTKPSVTEKRMSNWCHKIVDGYLVKDYCQSSCRVCDAPSSMPSTIMQPTSNSSSTPSSLLSNNPSLEPTSAPSLAKHTDVPSSMPSSIPNTMPSSVPPSAIPPKQHSVEPSLKPTAIPSEESS